MKKYLGFAAISVLTLSCANDERNNEYDMHAVNYIGNISGEPSSSSYKTAEYINQTASGAASLKPPTGGTISEIEIYALGAGGGGQGGNRNGTIYVSRGTGGSGGGGSAAYMKLGNNELKLGKNESVSLSVTVGTGGTGGEPNKNTFETAGCSGKDGGATTVTWSAKSITLNAPGGSGGGGSTTCEGKVVNGGAGGISGTANPPNSALYDGNPLFVSGKNGSNGHTDSGESPIAASGGSAAIINKGTLSSFGGGSGSIRQAGSSNRSAAGNGGGGTSGHMDQAGIKGGNGLVTIVYKYYTEE